MKSPAQVREPMEAAPKGIRPTATIVNGMYQRFSGQIGETAQFVREIPG